MLDMLYVRIHFPLLLLHLGLYLLVERVLADAVRCDAVARFVVNDRDRGLSALGYCTTLRCTNIAHGVAMPRALLLRSTTST